MRSVVDAARRRRNQSPDPAATPQSAAHASPGVYTVGVVSSYLGGVYFSKVIDGIHETLRRRGHRMLVIRSFDESPHAPGLANSQIDAWIFLPFAPGIEQAQATGKPVAAVSIDPQESRFPTVIADNRNGIQAAVQHLLAHGHRRIAFCGWLGHSEIVQRFELYQEALALAGLPFSPDLLIESPDNLESGGRYAAATLVEGGIPCSAVIVGTDQTALGLMKTFQKQGYRIPDDLAVIGYDDITEAHYADPPLTTVRQQIDLLGARAVELVLAQLAGHAVPTTPHLLETRLICRDSCGCRATPLVLGEQATPEPADQLARRMVELLINPAPLAPETPPVLVWPGITVVLQSYHAALTGAPAPRGAALDRAWRQAAELNASPETLLGLVRVLARDSRRRAADEQAEERVEQFLEQARLSLMRARLSREVRQVDQLGQIMHSSYAMNIALLSDQQSALRSLAWLAPTEAIWGCLGLWEDDSRTTLLISGVYCRDAEPPQIPPRMPVPVEEFPPATLLPPAAQASPHAVTLLPVTSAGRQWGVLAVLGATGVEMVSDMGNLSMWGVVLSAAIEHESLLASLREQQETLRLAYERERAAVRDLEERTRILGLLHQANQQLHSCTTLDAGLARIEQVLPQIFPGTTGVLAYRGRAAPALPALACWGTQLDETPIDLDGCRLLQRAPGGQADAHTGCTQCSRRPGAQLCVPLRQADKLMGVLQVRRQTDGAPGLPDESLGRLTTMIADHLQLALTNIQLREALRQQAQRDPLTGLHNRRYLNDRFGRELERAARVQTPLSVIIADIDHFKRINDVWGHALGDRVLQMVAQQLRLNLRHGDAVCRIGGEEFVLLLPDAPPEAARQRAEQLRALIRAARLPDAEGLPPITLSWGIAAFPQHGQSADELLTRADETLYRAKAAGRDRVLLADTPPTELLQEELPAPEHRAA
ncbi:MAG TPA: diguanylate cyclase [Roseiflexaceae bacterium]|nr:diguanylate cyclase [Roseiflexaceae bacterium]